MEIEYLNVDLELSSNTTLEPIIEAFGDRVVVLHHRVHDGAHFAAFESADQFDHPEPAIRELCGLATGLAGSARSGWESCTKRVLDLGFNCGHSPRCYQVALSPGALRLINDLEITLALSLYPPPAQPGPGAS